MNTGLVALCRAAHRSMADLLEMLEAVARFAAPPVMRVALALPFLRSGLTRWEPFPNLSIGTRYLFEEQFKLHLLGHLVDLPAPLLVAYVTALAEIILPLMLLAGLATRLAAAGLLLMTAVIQLVVPEGWANFHLYWAALALGLIALGAGALSLDTIIGRNMHAPRGEPHVER